MKLTVPPGGEAPAPAFRELITAVTARVLPGAGVEVAGVTTVVVELGCT
jgi:hypothetical protein